MTLSVVMATYNRRDALMRAVASVRDQTDPDIECLVVGDGTDAASMEALARLDDPRLRCWNLPHADYPADPNARWCAQGTTALNWGLDHANGQWVTFMGDDDELVPSFATTLLAATQDADVVYGRSEVVGHGYLGSWPPRPSGFVHTMWRADMGYRFDPDCWRRGVVADWDLWARMLADGRRWRFVPAVVYRYAPATKIPVVDEGYAA